MKKNGSAPTRSAPIRPCEMAANAAAKLLSLLAFTTESVTPSVWAADSTFRVGLSEFGSVGFWEIGYRFGSRHQLVKKLQTLCISVGH